MVLIIILQIGGLFYIHSQYPTYPLTITFFNVGQGDSVLIETENNEKILIDTGPDSRIVEKLSEKFKALNNTIDYVILTHPDMDHVGGMLGLLENFEIKNIIYNFKLDDLSSKYFIKLKSAVEGEKSVLIGAVDTSDFNIDNCLLDFVWPEEVTKKLSDNDSSISIKINCNGFDTFLGGDISTDIEKKIENKLGQVELMKLSHHGSSTSNSEEFIKILNPRYVVISVGKDNKFNHPNPNILGILTKNDLEYFRTDEVGDVVCTIKDEKDFVCKPSFF